MARKKWREKMDSNRNGVKKVARKRWIGTEMDSNQNGAKNMAGKQWIRTEMVLKKWRQKWIRTEIARKNLFCLDSAKTSALTADSWPLTEGRLRTRDVF
jgi:hypothetical protein